MLHTAVKIGSSLITVQVGEWEKGTLKIIGYGNCPAEGIKNDDIEDKETFIRSLATAIYQAERSINKKIKTVSIALESRYIHSKMIKLETDVPYSQVSEVVYNNLLKKTLRHLMPNETILHLLPLKSLLDHHVEVSDPIGRTASHLTIFLQLITIPSTILENFSKCFSECLLNIHEFMWSTYAVCLSTQPQEKLLLYTGKTLSSVTGIRNNIPLFTSQVLLGGEHITRDIAKIFHTSEENAEKMKLKYGSLFPNDQQALQIIPSPPDRPKEEAQITHAILSRIIFARLDEILDLLMEKIPSTFFHKNIPILFYGGSTKIVGFLHMCTTKYHINVNPTFPDQSSEDPVILGLLLHAHDSSYEREKSNLTIFLPKAKNIWGSLAHWIKENI